jgi:hypothetical protein
VQQVPSILRPLCLWGSWIDVLCIFVLDIDPSNSGFGLRFEDFGWNLNFFIELGSLSIPGDLSGLRPQVSRHIIP